MSVFFTVIETINATSEVAEASNAIHSKLRMIYSYARHGYVRIAVVGVGGVGKSTLAKYLSNSKKYKNPVYRDSPAFERFKIGKNIIGRYWVAPGQEHRIESYWPQLYRSISKGKVKLIINVVAYGYHSVLQNISYQNMNNYYKPNMSPPAQRSLQLRCFYPEVCDFLFQPSTNNNQLQTEP